VFLLMRPTIPIVTQARSLTRAHVGQLEPRCSSTSLKHFPTPAPSFVIRVTIGDIVFADFSDANSAEHYEQCQRSGFPEVRSP